MGPIIHMIGMGEAKHLEPAHFLILHPQALFLRVRMVLYAAQLELQLLHFGSLPCQSLFPTLQSQPCLLQVDLQCRVSCICSRHLRRKRLALPLAVCQDSLLLHSLSIRLTEGILQRE